MLGFLRRLTGRAPKQENELPVEVEYPGSMRRTPAPSAGSEALDFDWVLVTVVSLLVGLGAVMVYSASVSLADSPKYGTTTTHFFVRHICFILIALAAASGVYRIPMRIWRRATPFLSGIAVLLLVLVLIPHVGLSINGSRRWLPMGIMNLQVSEVTKFMAVLAASYFVVTHQDYMHSVRKGFFPMVLSLSVVAILLLQEPDLGATAVVTLIVVGIMFIGGLSIKMFIPVAAGVAGMVALMILITPWRLQRFMAYLDPWNEENVLGKAYQLSHSLIAFGRGEIFGAGLGGSVEKLNYLPEAHTDFIFAVVGEELGFVGVTVVLLLYYRLIRSAFEIGRVAIKMDNIFSGLVAQGIGIWIGSQVLINVGVATGLLPTKGLTLPLMSYGGSALLMTLCAIAVLMRIDRESRVQMHGGTI